MLKNTWFQINAHNITFFTLCTYNENHTRIIFRSLIVPRIKKIIIILSLIIINWLLNYVFYLVITLVNGLFSFFEETNNSYINNLSLKYLKIFIVMEFPQNETKLEALIL